MTSSEMMIIGDYPFSLATAAYESLTRVASWRWRKQERLGATPIQQYLGADSQTIRVEGFILPHFRGGLNQIEAMREEAAKGEPLVLMNGRGVILGDWVIKSIEERHGSVLSDGTPGRIDFTMALEQDGRNEVVSP